MCMGALELESGYGKQITSCRRREKRIMTRYYFSVLDRLLILLTIHVDPDLVIHAVADSVHPCH
jgi:hypothetical protein